MSDLNIHFSTGKDNWETPDELFTNLAALYDFVLDAAANETNHKCPVWFGPGGVVEDALTADWTHYLAEGDIWLNPPYSRGLQSKFVIKAVKERDRALQTGAEGQVVCLLPARTDTKLFHEVVLPHGKVTFLKGRVKFKGAAQGAPFPSMIVVF